MNKWSAGAFSKATVFRMRRCNHFRNHRQKSLPPSFPEICEDVKAFAIIVVIISR